MNNLTPNELFDLSLSSFPEIFADIEYVWEALPKISSFLKRLPLGKIEGKVSPQAYLEEVDKIYIGPGVVVEPGAYIKGPCYIGKNTEVRHGAYIRGFAIIDEECVVGHTTEVIRSILMRGAKAGHFAYIGDSILGNHVNLGAGTKLANLRLDRQEIRIKWNDKKIPTGLRKFGAILGDKVETGCNSVTNPGTIMGKQSVCYPCFNGSGIVPEKGVCR